MRQKLFEKIAGVVNAEPGLDKKLKRKVLERVKADQILPMLKLHPDEAHVEISLTKTDVNLVVGPRDFQFDRKTGELVGTGTCLL